MIARRSAANRVAAGIAEGDTVDVDLTLDNESRVVSPPADLAAALDASPESRAAFNALPFGLQRKHVAHIEIAKTIEVRQRRIGKLVVDLKN